MGSAFAVEFTIPADVRRERLVLFAHSAPDVVLHWPWPECRIECPHPIKTCGVFRLMTIDDLIELRNSVQMLGENSGRGEATWERLGVANRHIDRVLNNVLTLSPAVEREITECCQRVERILRADSSGG